MRFTQEFVPLSAAGSEVGTIAPVPWDTATFGFGVGDLRPSLEAPQPDQPAALSKALSQWCTANDVRLVGASLPARAGGWINALESAGFRYVDSTLGLRWQRIHRSEFQTLGCAMRSAGDDDFDLAVQIAEVAFHHGRYHADPRFPRALADRRYRHWLERTREPESKQQVLVFDAHDEIGGFTVVETNGTTGYFHLMAVNPALQGLIGAGLGAATMVYLRDLGVRNVRSKVSVSNAAVLNVHIATGARATDPEVLLHWYAD